MLEYACTFILSQKGEGGGWVGVRQTHCSTYSSSGFGFLLAVVCPVLPLALWLWFFFYKTTLETTFLCFW